MIKWHLIFPLVVLSTTTALLPESQTGLVAPRDKSLTVIGDDGIFFVPYLRNDQEPVLIHRDYDYENQRFVERLLTRVKSKVEYVANQLQIKTDKLGYYQKYPMVKGKSFSPVDWKIRRFLAWASRYAGFNT